MSGFEVVGVLLGLYPIVVDAVNLYKATKTGRAAASLIRKLKIESQIYRQFVYKLLAPNISPEEISLLLAPETLDLDRWKAVTLDKKLRDRLGLATSELILEILGEIDDLLRDLSIELSSIGRGMEVLDKFRVGLRVAKHSQPQSNFQQRLIQLTTLNGDLNRLVDGKIHVTVKHAEENPPDKFLVRDYQEAIELFNFISHEAYDCDCHMAHVTNFGLNRPAPSTVVPLSDLKSRKWDFELVLSPSEDAVPTMQALSTLSESEESAEPEDVGTESETTPQRSRQGSEQESPLPPLKRERSRSISIKELSGTQTVHDDRRPIFTDLCAYAQNLNNNNPATGHLGIIGNSKKRWKLCIKPDHEAVSMDITCLEELLKPDYTLMRKDRMQLALQLSCSILQFHHTGWIDSAWTSKDFCVLSLKEETKDTFAQLFVTRRFYSARILSEQETPLQDVNNIWTWYDEPILTKLGFLLIELAIGRRLSEIRKDKKPATDIESEDTDFQNMETATALLNSGQLARESSQAYEDVVRACIKHQYAGRSSSGPQGLSSKDVSFFERAEESIIGPLYAEYVKRWPN